MATVLNSAVLGFSLGNLVFTITAHLKCLSFRLILEISSELLT